MNRRILLTVLAIAASAGCTPEWARQNDSDVMLLMDRIVGSTEGGGTGGGGGAVLLSDPRTPQVVNDNASLTLRALLKNPQEGVLTGDVNDVLVRRYTVRYYRADGRSVEGVDVPYSITGDMHALVPVGGNVTTSIIVVRHQAKLEPPLRNFVGFGGQGALTMYAEITVYGETISRKAVTATGRLEIVFIDFADSTT